MSADPLSHIELTNTGPSRHWYVVGGALWVLGFAFAFTVLYARTADLSDRARDYPLATADKETVVVLRETGEHTIYAERARSAGGAKDDDISVKVTDAAGHQVPLLPSSDPGYRISRASTPLDATGIRSFEIGGDSPFPPGRYTVAVLSSDRAVRHVAVGPTLGGPGYSSLGLGVLVSLVGLVLLFIVARRRGQRANQLQEGG